MAGIRKPNEKNHQLKLVKMWFTAKQGGHKPHKPLSEATVELAGLREWQEALCI